MDLLLVAGDQEVGPPSAAIPGTSSGAGLEEELLALVLRWDSGIAGRG